MVNDQIWLVEHYSTQNMAANFSEYIIIIWQEVENMQ